LPPLAATGYQLREAARFVVSSDVTNRAKALIDETGAKAYEPMMLRMRVRAGDEKNLASSSRP